MAIREGAWDCPVCGRKGNRGPDKFCGGCGAPRGPEVKFYLPEDAPEVTDAAALEKAKAAPDWICPYCAADNPDSASFCTGCGAPRDGAKQRQVIEHRFDAPPPPPPPAQAAPAKPGNRKVFTLGCLGLIVLAVLFALFSGPKDKTLTVTGFRWERVIDVEAAETVVKEEWQDDLPAGARSLSSQREVRGYNKIQIGTETRTRTVTEQVQVGTEQVKVGVRDLGNGYFEDVYESRPVYENVSREETYEEPVYREEPVYGTKVRYEIEEWQSSRTERATGQDLSPLWPDPGLGGREREKDRKEKYQILFEDEDGKDYTYETTSESEWRGFEVGRAYEASVKRNGEVVEVNGPSGG